MYDNHHTISVPLFKVVALIPKNVKIETKSNCMFLFFTNASK